MIRYGNEVGAGKALLLAFTLMLATVLPAAGQPAPVDDTVDDELLVLLRPGLGHPRAEEVVAAVNSGHTPVPGGLGEGNPHRAELVIREYGRSHGAAREQLLAEPDQPRARLERYIVLHYRSVAAIPGLLIALQRNPNVEFSERNRPLRFHSVSGRPGTGKGPLKAQVPFKDTLPGDEFFRPADPENPNPEAYQWGSYSLNLPGAWDVVEGDSPVALLDLGIQLGHPDLEPFDDSGGAPIFLGGNFRGSMSFDYIRNDCEVDEKISAFSRNMSHGTHVSGLVAATPNGSGVAGACWHCPIMMAQIWSQDTPTGLDDAGRAITDMVDKGVELISMSFGVVDNCGPPELDLTVLCNALAHANDRDVIMTAAVGNDRSPTVEFPGIDSRVIAVGGISPDGSLWDEWPDCPRGPDDNYECGSNFGTGLELLAPARSIYSTAYTGADWNVGCGDSYGAAGTATDGFGLCTGTSMASPYVAGVAAHPRTANPLLSQGQVREILKRTASLGGDFDFLLGYGIPDAGAAVREAMGYAGGLPLRNRLTPFFVLYSELHTAHLCTTSPQRAAAAVAGVDGIPFLPVGPEVPAYPTLPDSTPKPRAYVFLFTTPHTPSGQTFGLVPVYRMSKDPNREFQCTGIPDPDAQWAFAYARDASEILALRAEGFSLDGIEGYVIDPSSPLPAGAVLLHRLFNPELGDWVIVPTDVIPGLAPGYGPRAGFPEIVGAAIDNVDSDGDGVIDGFETILRTNPSVPDSDGDGVGDGDEILGYTGATPTGILGDPLCIEARCLFTDSFETGDRSRWSLVAP